MSTTPTPPAAEPAVSTPVVPYGPPASSADGGAPRAAMTLDLSGATVGRTVAKWGFRILLPLLIRAIFRAIFR